MTIPTHGDQLAGDHEGHQAAPEKTPLRVVIGHLADSHLAPPKETPPGTGKRAVGHSVGVFYG